jgi:hypothetical protein
MKAMPYLIVEYDHDPPLTDERLAIDSAALGPCLESRSIRRLRSWISQDRRRALCEFYAADAESVREAYRSAKVNYLRIWSGTLFEPGELPDDG